MENPQTGETNKEESILKYFSSRTGSASKMNAGEHSLSRPIMNESSSVPYRSSFMEEEKTIRLTFQTNQNKNGVKEGQNVKGASSTSNAFFQKPQPTTSEEYANPHAVKAPPNTKSFAAIIDLEEIIPPSTTNQIFQRTSNLNRVPSPGKNEDNPKPPSERKIARAVRDPTKNTVIPKKDPPKAPEQKLPVRRVASKSKPNASTSQSGVMAQWVNDAHGSKTQMESRSKRHIAKSLAEMVNDGAKSMPAAPVKITRTIRSANEEEKSVPEPKKNNDKESNKNLKVTQAQEGCKDGKKTGNRGIKASTSVKGSSPVNQEKGMIIIGKDFGEEPDIKPKQATSRGRPGSKPKNFTQTDISNFVNRLS